jgi:cellulose synthase/poly-beta-1,6-N-acetylglucosamine synthase-like glycosyltransferase
LTLVDNLLAILWAILALPALIVFLESVLALFGKTPADAAIESDIPGVATAILVPAHDEAVGIAATVQSLKSESGPAARLIVIADNCTDRTAELAKAAGAEVVERQDPERRGKGYALAHGVDFLRDAPPQIVIIIDADCRTSPGTLHKVAETAYARGCPVQARYTMKTPAKAAANQKWQSFAWRIKNHVRPMGLRTLGLPCQLMGTGMAIPWKDISQIDLATGHLVEDVRMGLQLASIGSAPVYCPEAEVLSEFPGSETGRKTQRERWEAGSLQVLTSEAPRALFRGAVTGNLNLLIMALDLFVPPLVMYFAVLLLSLFIAGAWIIVGGSMLPAAIAALALSGLLMAAGLAWAKFGRKLIGPFDLLELPLLLARKLMSYPSLWRGRRRSWVRTERK